MCANELEYRSVSDDTLVLKLTHVSNFGVPLS